MYYFSAGPCWVDLVKETELYTPADATTLLVPLATIKQQCRVESDVDDDDDLLTNYCNAAEKLIEELAEITLREKVYNLNLARWPGYTDYLELRLETTPVQSITHIKYYDEVDTQRTLASNKYELWFSRKPPRITVHADNVPALSTQRAKTVEIRFVAGLDLTDLQATADYFTVQNLVLELCAFWYMHREAAGKIPAMSNGAQARVFQSQISSLRWRGYP
jgi:uncharacterized phiE125 gp8 family phage protein